MSKSKKTNNINFIATYIFVHPLCTATDIRRALYYSKNHTLHGFSERGWATSYFYARTNHRGYPSKYWYSPARSKWLLTDQGMAKIRPGLIEKVKFYRKKCVEFRLAG